MQVVQDHLDDGERTVRTHIDISHDAATLPGSTVRLTATLDEIDGRRPVFTVQAVEEDGTVVSRGTHRRAVINLARFEAKAAERSRRTAPAPGR